MIRGHTGETALRGGFIAPAFLPLLRRGRSTGMNRMQAQTRPSVSESTVMLKANRDVLRPGRSPQTNPRTGSRNMAAEVIWINH